MFNKINEDNAFLSFKKSKPCQRVRDIINKALPITNTARFSEILIKNPYEKMIPFNLWFYCPNYHVENYYENNQNLRTRFFNTTLLTPLVSVDNRNLESINKFKEKLSLYQPFYPETFYTMWEFLKTQYIGLSNQNFLHIGKEDRLGSMEAIVFYHERYQMTYQYNKYHCWLAGKEMYDAHTGYYKMMVPEINYLDQAYKITFLRCTKDLIKYNLISIDSNHMFNSIFKWKEEELDLQAMLLYFFTAIEHLVQGGSMIIKLNLTACSSWQIIFDISYRYFKEYAFYRPTISNPFNPEVYLFLTKFNASETTKTLYNGILKNLYRGKVYLKFYLNPEIIPENPITKKYQEIVDKWCLNLEAIIKNFNKKSDITNDCILEWHTSNDLKQIQDLSPDFNEGTIEYEIMAKVLPKLKPILPIHLYKLSAYKKLIGKRAELNYHKRVMDTKPSQIFADNNYNRNSYLLTWEKLTYEMDIYKNLKNILKTQYNAEMVTNAWIKMYEIINITKNLIPLKECVKTFHLCEAPGAFISAINHYISNRGSCKMDWYAQTLRQTNSGQESDAALSDHFGLIASYPNRWIFGNKDDNSGDITHSAVIKSYMTNPLLADIDLMTSDAGLQCDPADLNEQESYLGKINMGQIICILACLPVGKSAIFKTFLPMTEPLTISLMYLITNLFNQVKIIKPSSSHSSNSEIYVVLREYRGIDKNLLDMLLLLLDDPNITSKTLLFDEIDKIFFESYMKTITNLIDRQIKSLCRNYYYYYHLDKINEFKKENESCIDKWLIENPVFILRNPLLRQNKETKLLRE